MSTLLLSSMASGYAAERGSASAKKDEITQTPPCIGQDDVLRGRAPHVNPDPKALHTSTPAWLINQAVVPAQ